jgi:hypothetical protein
MKVFLEAVSKVESHLPARWVLGKHPEEAALLG